MTSPDEREITVITRRYDGSVKRRWSAQVTRYDPPLIELLGIFDLTVEHPLLGRILKGTASQEYYWQDRWYNVFLFHEPSGGFRNFYCNINMPPRFGGKTLEYIDLDIDVVIWPDRKYTVLDEEEFQENSRRYHYPRDLRSKVASALDELRSLVEKNRFPFDMGHRG